MSTLTAEPTTTIPTDPSNPSAPTTPRPIPPIPSFPSQLLPPRHLTLLLGDPGVGKSLLAIDLAARLSKNSPPPPLPHQIRMNPAPTPPEDANPKDYMPATAIILSREDSFDTLNLRLAAADANGNFLSFPDSDLSMVSPNNRDLHQCIEQNLKPAPLSEWLFIHLSKIRNPRLLILDPLPAFLGLKDCSNPAVIRRHFEPLEVLAHQYNLAVLGISHLTKPSPHNRRDNPLHRCLGSLAYTALARSVLLLQPDPQNPSRRLLKQIKNNLAPLHPTLAFTITALSPSSRAPSPGTPTAPVLQWDPTPIPNSLTEGTPLPRDSSTQFSPDPFQQSQLEEATHFLQTTLQNGPIPSAQLLKEARSLGISTRTLTRAKFDLGIKSFRNLQTHQWLAALPAHLPPPNPSAEPRSGACQ